MNQLKELPTYQLTKYLLEMVEQAPQHSFPILGKNKNFFFNPLFIAFNKFNPEMIRDPNLLIILDWFFKNGLYFILFLFLILFLFFYFYFLIFYFLIFWFYFIFYFKGEYWIGKNYTESTSQDEMMVSEEILFHRLVKNEEDRKYFIQNIFPFFSKFSQFDPHKTSIIPLKKLEDYYFKKKIIKNFYF